LLGAARLESKRALELVKRVAVFFLPGVGGRLQRVEELLLLLAIEHEILTSRGKGTPASLGLDPIREVRNRLGDDGPAPELRHQEGRSSLGHAPISIGEEEADGRHCPSISRSLFTARVGFIPRGRGTSTSGAMARIEDYSFGRVTVDGEEHTHDVIVLPRRVVRDWWRRDGHSLVLDDLDEVLPDLPQRLIIGTGAYGRMIPDPNALEQLRERGVEIEVLPTDDAVRRYGTLNPAATAAALHLTC
jgi:hypothetical protein